MQKQKTNHNLWVEASKLGCTDRHLSHLYTSVISIVRRKTWGDTGRWAWNIWTEQMHMQISQKFKTALMYPHTLENKKIFIFCNEYKFKYRYRFIQINKSYLFPVLYENWIKSCSPDQPNFSLLCHTPSSFGLPRFQRIIMKFTVKNVILKSNSDTLHFGLLLTLRGKVNSVDLWLSESAFFGISWVYFAGH